MLKRVMVAGACASLFYAAGVDAKETKYKDTPVETKSTDRLLITGFKGSVKLVPAAGAQLTVRARKSIADKWAGESNYDAWSFAVRREENTIVVEAKGPEAKSDWQAQLGRVPELHIEIEGPSLPAEILWRDGAVTAQGWKSPLSVTLVDGAVRAAKIEGNLRAQVQKGEIKVDGHRGRLDLDSFSAKVAVSELEGDVNLENFLGGSVLQDLRGNIQLKTHSGPTSVTKTAGNIDFEIHRGSLNLQGFEGAIGGQSEEGAVSAQIEGEPDVNIETNQAAVSLKLPATAGASVRLQTEDGSLVAPDYLRTNRGETTKSVVGRLKGAGKGTVVVKTKTGTVRLR